MALTASASGEPVPPWMQAILAACEPAVRSLLNQSQPALIVVSIPDARGGVSSNQTRIASTA